MTRLMIVAAVVAVIACTGARAEQTVRLNVALTCSDIRALAAWQGWEEIERRARAAGATDKQIDAARRCK